MDILVDGELILYGAVGDSFFEPGFTARDVINALATIRGKDVTVRLNSGGGFADEGVAIYNSLKNHGNRITVYVDGIAASAASLIAMAGDEIVMRTGSTMMIHDPMILAVGNAAELAKGIEQLNAAAESMADIYASKTGKTSKQMRADMKEEIWLTPDDAVSMGYADRKDKAEAIEASAFDYRAYTKAPAQIVALSDTRAWSNRLKVVKATAAITQEPPMADMITKEAAATEAAALVKDASEKAATEATKTEQDRTADIVEACVKSETIALAPILIRDGSTIDQAKARIDGAKDIRAAVTLARKSCPTIDATLADQFIASGASIDKVRSDLFERIAATQAAKPTRSAHQAATGADDPATMRSAWDKQVGKVNARHPGNAA